MVQSAMSKNQSPFLDMICHDSSFHKLDITMHHLFWWCPAHGPSSSVCQIAWRLRTARCARAVVCSAH